MNLFFLAAGLGARLRPLTHKYPKPCVPFLNVPLAYYQFRFLEPLKISSCVANSFHLPEKIEELYTTQTYFKNKIIISEENDVILGSAGGLKKAAQHFSTIDTILMINADEIFFTDDNLFLQKAYQQHTANNNLATLIVMEHPEAGNKFGAIWCDGKKVKNIGKTSAEQTLKPLHYIGMIFLNKKILELIPENTETNIFYDILINELSRNSVEVYKLNCSWYETGNPTDYLLATKSALNTLDEKTLQFINCFDPSRLVKNDSGISLISNLISIDEKKLKGFNVISGSTNPQNLRALDTIENSVFFENEILNLGYFS